MCITLSTINYYHETSKQNYAKPKCVFEV